MKDNEIDINALAEQLTIDEGLRLKPYHCTAGKLTIGIGRNLEDRGISQQEAEFLLYNDIKNATRETIDVIGEYTWKQLSSVRKNILVNMMFNLGVFKFKKFKKMITAVQEADFFQASIEMQDSKWFKQVGFRAKRLAQEMVIDGIVL